jgi:hypothetical protein
MVWEYRVITFNTEYETMADAVLREAIAGTRLSGAAKSCDIIQGRLAMEGTHGWELVALMPAFPSTSPQDCQDISVPNPWMYHAIFKRPKDQQ